MTANNPSKFNCTIRPVIGHTANREGLHKIYFRIIHRRMKVDYPTPIRVKREHFENGKVVRSPKRQEQNNALKSLKKDLQLKLLPSIIADKIETKKAFQDLLNTEKKEQECSIDELITTLNELKATKERTGIMIKVIIKGMPESVLASLK